MIRRNVSGLRLIIRRLKLLRLATQSVVKRREIAIQKDTKEPHEKQCEKCGASLVLRPVPGATSFPRRLECPTHGWPNETVRAIRMRFHKDRPDW